MKARKHWIIVLIGIIVGFGGCDNPTRGNGGTDYSPEYWFEFDDDGALIASAAFPDSTTSIVIPSTLGRIPVTSIGVNAFNQGVMVNDEWVRRVDLSSVVIPNSVTSIGRQAFAGNSLTSVLIPNSVVTIETVAFPGNNLISVILGNNVTNIGTNVFAANHNLTTVTVRLRQGETQAQAEERLGENWPSGITGNALISFVQ